MTNIPLISLTSTHTTLPASPISYSQSPQRRVKGVLVGKKTRDYIATHRHTFLYIARKDKCYCLWLLLSLSYCLLPLSCISPPSSPSHQNCQETYILAGRVILRMENWRTCDTYVFQLSLKRPCKKTDCLINFEFESIGRLKITAFWLCGHTLRSMVPVKNVHCLNIYSILPQYLLLPAVSVPAPSHIFPSITPHCPNIFSTISTYMWHTFHCL